MIRLKTLVPALALMGSLIPLAANARSSGMRTHEPAETLMLVSSAQHTSVFGPGRMEDHSSRGTAIMGAMRYALMNTDAQDSGA